MSHGKSICNITTSIPFNGETYLAVITQVDGSVNVYFPDESLHHLFPQGRFTYNPNERTLITTPKLDPLQRLENAVLDAVALSTQTPSTEGYCSE